MATKVFFDKVAWEGEVLKLDLKIKDIPKDFLGISFDMNFLKGKEIFNKLKLEKYVIGPEFSKFRGGDLNPISLLADSVAKNGKIMFGFTFRGDSIKEMNFSDEVLLGSFYFRVYEGGKFRVSLQNGVLSILENDLRKDVLASWGKKDVSVADGKVTSGVVSEEVKIFSPEYFEEDRVDAKIDQKMDEKLKLGDIGEFAVVKDLNPNSGKKRKVEKSSIVEINQGEGELVDDKFDDPVVLEEIVTDKASGDDVGNLSEGGFNDWFILILVMFLVLIFVSVKFVFAKNFDKLREIYNILKLYFVKK